MSIARQGTYELKTLSNGNENPKYIDVLAEDPAVRGQEYVVLSFLSPEDIIKNRDRFFFEKFVAQWDRSKHIEDIIDFIHYIAFRTGIDANEMVEQFTEFVKSEDPAIRTREKSTIEDDYSNFIDVNENKLETEYLAKHPFQTGTRGVKVRGSYATEEQANAKCKEISKFDEDNNILIGPVGKWLPWNPDLYKLGKIEYLEPELNQLYQEKIKNEKKAKEEFEKRKNDMKKRAVEANMEKAEKQNTVVTQTIDPETGNITGVKDYVDFDSREIDDAKLAESMKPKINKEDVN